MKVRHLKRRALPFGLTRGTTKWVLREHKGQFSPKIRIRIAIRNYWRHTSCRIRERYVKYSKVATGRYVTTHGKKRRIIR